MKNYKNLIAIVFSFYFLSCNNLESTKNHVIFEGFPEEFFLQGSTIEGVNEKIYPRYIGLYNDLLVLCDPIANPHFYAYKLPNFEFLGKFGNQGKGPTDIEDPLFLGQIEKKEDSILISTFQMRKTKFVTFNMNKALVDSLRQDEMKATYLPPEIDEAVHVIKLNNTFFGSGFSKLGEFFIYEPNEDLLTWKSFITDYDDEFMNSLKENHLLDFYKYSMLKSKPDKSLFVKAYNFIPKISVFDEKGDELFSIINKSRKKPTIESDMNFDKDTKMYYFNTFLTDNFIYALYVNCSLELFNKGEMSDVEIHVFDWNGSPIKKIILNEGIGSHCPFVVDEKNKKIYTINPISEDSYFREFSYN